MAIFTRGEGPSWLEFAVPKSRIERTKTRRRASMGSTRRQRSIFLLSGDKLCRAIFFSFGQRVLPDEEGIELSNRTAARDEALAVVRDLANSGVEGSRRRWAGWFLQVEETGSNLSQGHRPSCARDRGAGASCRRIQIEEVGRDRRPAARRRAGKANGRRCSRALGAPATRRAINRTQPTATARTFIPVRRKQKPTGACP